MNEVTRGLLSGFAAFFKSGGGFSISGNAGAPSSGTSGTFVNTYRANPGSLLVDTTNKILYINTNTKASPTWTKVGTQT